MLEQPAIAVERTLPKPAHCFGVWRNFGHADLTPCPSLLQASEGQVRPVCCAVVIWDLGKKPILQNLLTANGHCVIFKPLSGWAGWRAQSRQAVFRHKIVFLWLYICGVVAQLWLECRPVTPEVAGSSPVCPAIFSSFKRSTRFESGFLVCTPSVFD